MAIKRRKERIKKRTVERFLVNGWSTDEILVQATTKKNGRDVRLFRNIGELEVVVKEIKESWNEERDEVVRGEIVSLNRTISLIDLQMARLHDLLLKEKGKSSASEAKRINIEKRITEVALARHSLIAGAATSKRRSG